MPLLNSDDLSFADLIRSISFANPFLQKRVDLERQALGDDYIEIGAAKAFLTGEGPNPNARPLLKRAEAILAALQGRAEKAKATQRDRLAAGDLALFVLYHRHVASLYELAAETGPHALAPASSKKLKIGWYRQFEADTESLLMLGGQRLRQGEAAEDLFALFFQMARAFHNTFASFIGQSKAAIALRASIWQSIFTHDLARYWRELQKSLSDRSRSAAVATLTSDIPTLITGPSGSGKELVAQAVGRSGFVPFDKRTSSFEIDQAALFMPIHLAALSPSLIESELFGHRRGAFTGALEDRASFLETCAPYGARVYG